MIQKWYNRNRASLEFFLIVSASVGPAIAGICLFFPSVLVALSGLSIFGIAPLAFLTAIYFPLALLSLALITPVLSISILVVCMAVMRQIAIIGTHLFELFDKEELPNQELFTSDSYLYLQSHLQGVLNCDDEDEDDDIEESPGHSNGETNAEETIFDDVLFSLELNEPEALNEINTSYYDTASMV